MNDLMNERKSNGTFKNFSDFIQRCNTSIINNKLYNEKEAFLNRLETQKDKLGNQYQSFLDYWTEPDAKGKMRYQDQKFFDIARRVGTWIKNSKNFEPNTTTKIKLK